MQGRTTLESENRLRVSIKEAARLLSISKRMLEYRIAQKLIRVVRDGRRVLITLAELRRYANTTH